MPTRRNREPAIWRLAAAMPERNTWATRRVWMLLALKCGQRPGPRVPETRIGAWISSLYRTAHPINCGIWVNLGAGELHRLELVAFRLTQSSSPGTTEETSFLMV